MTVEAKSLIVQVKANLRALASCPDHDFQRERSAPDARALPLHPQASFQFVSSYRQSQAHAGATK
ncbi:hypothetical protein ABNQ39_37010 (plasmid) [Azospirillum sp. A26]|uniref:hypothetical protein n=1 Tax=Azospirillum sp. A26 TaxID=3160607 RepID=UPI003672EBC6